MHTYLATESEPLCLMHHHCQRKVRVPCTAGLLQEEGCYASVHTPPLEGQQQGVTMEFKSIQACQAGRPMQRLCLFKHSHSFNLGQKFPNIPVSLVLFVAVSPGLQQDTRFCAFESSRLLSSSLNLCVRVPAYLPTYLSLFFLPFPFLFLFFLLLNI